MYPPIVMFEYLNIEAPFKHSGLLLYLGRGLYIHMSWCVCR